MIDKVSIRNFQSLQDVEVSLGVLTVILGPNDTGKSAFFRAVRSVADPLPGTSFITYGKTQSRVTLELDGHKVVWEKGQTVNRYFIDDAVYEKVGRSVPPDVTDLLGMGDVDFDKTLTVNLNFADQDDPPFLIPFPGGMTSSAVAKILGDLTNLNLIYRAVGAADARRRKAESTSRVRRTDVENLEQQLQEFEDVDALENRLEKLDALYAEANTAHDRFLSLSYLRNEENQLRSRYATLKADESLIGADRSPELAEVVEAQARLDELLAAKDRLKELTGNVTMIESALRAPDTVLDSAQEELDGLLAGIEVCPLCDQPIVRDVQHTHA